MPPRKPPTRGAKQIIIKLSFQKLTYAVTFFRIVLSILMNIRTFKPSLDSLTWEIVLSNTLLPITMIILCKIMKRMSEPVYSEYGRVLYTGNDLSQLCREAVLIISLAHIFSAFSTWFRYALWYLPPRIFCVCLKTIVVPTALQFLKETKIITEDHEGERYGAKPKKNKKKIKYLRTIRHWHNFKC